MILTNLLSLVDRLIQLATLRQATDRKIFDDFVKPAYADMEAIHADYISGLRKLEIASEHSSVNALVEMVEELRAPSLAVRDRMRKLAETLSTNKFMKDKEIRDYFRSIVEYFSFTYDDPTPHNTTTFMYFLACLKKLRSALEEGDYDASGFDERQYGFGPASKMLASYGNFRGFLALEPFGDQTWTMKQIVTGVRDRLGFKFNDVTNAYTVCQTKLTGR